jgi:phospholipase/carboxylesterase/glyoxalase family protein
MAAALDFVHVYEPPAQAGRPTLLMLHGTGGNEHDLVAAGRVLLPGAGILSPRGKVLERGMPRFFRRLAEGVFDLEDLKFRAAELAAFVAAAAAHYSFDPARVIAAGFSNGANIAASLLLLSPGTLKAAALFSPMVPIVPDPLPGLHGVEVFISAGKRDPLVSPEHTAELAALLESCGAAVRVRWTEGGHSLGPEDVDAAARWLRELAI